MLRHCVPCKDEAGSVIANVTTQSSPRARAKALTSIDAAPTNDLKFEYITSDW